MNRRMDYDDVANFIFVWCAAIIVGIAALILLAVFA